MASPSGYTLARHVVELEVSPGHLMDSGLLRFSDVRKKLSNTKSGSLGHAFRTGLLRE